MSSTARFPHLVSLVELTIPLTWLVRLWVGHGPTQRRMYASPVPRSSIRKASPPTCQQLELSTLYSCLFHRRFTKILACDMME